jgi:hypothetical protein
VRAGYTRLSGTRQLRLTVVGQFESMRAFHAPALGAELFGAQILTAQSRLAQDQITLHQLPKNTLAIGNRVRELISKFQLIEAACSRFTSFHSPLMMPRRI